jgi:hypothetical protein
MRQVVAIAVFVLLFAAGSLSAATFEPISDAALVARAELVVRARVVDSASRLGADGAIVTESRLAIDEVLKGRASAEVIVTELGGNANGIIMIVPGAPEYRPGSRVVAFLKQRPNGTWFTANMGLGHFRFTPNHEGPELLTRVDTGIEVDDATAFTPRRADAFVNWVRGAAKGVKVSAAATLDTASHGRLVPATNAASDYVLKGGSPLLPIRWEGCDEGCLIPFFYNGSQPGVNSVQGMEDALDAWTNDPDSYVNLGLAGTTATMNIGSFDNENTIVLNNSVSPNVGQCDGSIACGIVWAADGNTHTFDGSTFLTALAGDVIIRPGTHSQNFFAALVAHEVGHALSLKHAPGSGALMSASIPSNATPSLKSYDREAMAEVYGDGAPCNPPVITATNGGGTVPFGNTRQLSVSVSGSAPFTYQWFRGTSGNINEPVGSNTDKFTTPQVTQSMSFWVQVTSQCGPGVANSGTITVTPEACDIPVITQEPVSQRIVPGATATLSVAATGTANLSYRWYRSATVGDTSTLVANTSQFTTPALQTTTSYWARVFNSCGEDFSQLAVITVAPENQCIAPSIASQPVGATIPLNQGITLSVGAAGDAPLSYQWYRGDSPDESQPIAGATSATLALPPFTTAGSHKYWVKVTNTCPHSAPARSNTVTVTVECGQILTPELFAPPVVPSVTSYDVEWTGALANTSSYELQEATNPAFTQNLRTFTVTGALKHTIPAHAEVTVDTRFYYRVRATNACTNQQTSFSRTASTVVTRPQPANSREFSISVPNTATQNFIQNYLVPGFGATATNGDTFTITIDQPWLTVFPASGALSAGGTTVQFTIAPAGLGVGSTTATVMVTRTQPSAAGGPTTNGSSNVALPFTVSKVTPVTPSPRDAAPPAGTLIIPAVAHADGIGTRFQSDVRIANVSNQAADYEVSFTPSSTNGLETGKKTILTIAAGETKGLEDVVKAWYGSGLLGEGGLGTLEIRPITELAPFSTFGSSRTYAVTDQGTLGQFVPAMGLDQFIGSFAQDSLNKLSLQQVANNANYRTNIGLVEGSGQPAEVTLRLIDGNNNLLREVTKSLPPYGQEQTSLTGVFGDIQVEDARVEMFVNSPTGKVTAVASLIDNKTSDPQLLVPSQAARVQASKYTMPGVAELNNGGSNFHTDMRIYNAGQAPATLTLNYYQQGSGTPVPAKHTITVDAGKVAAIDNVLPTLWDLSGTGGSVVIDGPPNASLVLTSRTFSRREDGGTFGQFVTGISATEGIGAGERALELLQMEQSELYRSNIGFVELTGKPVHIEVTAESPQSKITLKTDIHLQAHEYRQHRLFSELGFPNNVYNGRVTVRVLDGEGRIAAFGSVIDNRTVDPTYVPAQ